MLSIYTICMDIILTWELLFRYLKRKKIKVVWTLHDCWPFTGHCVYFQQVGCDKWKEECRHCPLTRQYPASMGIDRSRQNYLRKKETFTGIKDMTLLVPSYWLADRGELSERLSRSGGL